MNNAAAEAKKPYRLSFARTTVRVDRAAPEWGGGPIGHDLYDPEGRAIKVELGAGVAVERFTRDELMPYAKRAAELVGNGPELKKLACALMALVDAPAREGANVNPEVEAHYIDRMGDVPRALLGGCILRCTLEAGPLTRGESPESVGLRAVRAVLAAFGVA